MNDNHELDLEVLDLEMNWLQTLIDLRINIYFKTEKNLPNFNSVTPPEIPIESSYHQLLTSTKCTGLDRMILALSIAPYVRPQVLDAFFLKNNNLDRGFSEFGGIKGAQHRGFLPTVETAAFLCAGSDLQLRKEVKKSLSPNGPLRKVGIIKVGQTSQNEPQLSAQLYVDDHWMEYLISGREFVPEMSHEFPAQQITTDLEWKDLVLDEYVLECIDEIKQWIIHKDKLLNDWGLSKKLKSGYRTLFFGPPGTGKTLTASLIGKELNYPVFRVDLSLIVSKYIGETEKNLAKVFDIAESKGWILFFDEADALFGKRVQTSSSNDRYANQEVAFLLQRIEDCDGLVILATNLNANIDDAFSRRFQSMIYFPAPDKEERLLLWKFYFNGNLPVEEVDYKKLARDYELTGGNIVNVLRYASLKAASHHPNLVKEKDILEGVKREMKQMGRSL
ncbi:MAG: ATP-binding protein [Bacteroidota bacterium]